MFRQLLWWKKTSEILSIKLRLSFLFIVYYISYYIVPLGLKNLVHNNNKTNVVSGFYSRSPQSSSSKTNNCWRNSNWEMHTSCGLLLLLTDNLFIAVGTCGCHKTPKSTLTRLTAHQHAAAQLLQQVVETVNTK